jgi:hypothetical protein
MWYRNSCCSQVGCGPTASYLFCLAKKGNPKKATTLPLAFGYPIVQDKKWESVETVLRNVRLQANTVPQARRMRLKFPATPQTATLSLSIFCPAQLAVSEVDEGQKQKQRQRQHQNNQYRRSFIFLIAVVGRCFRL